MPSTENKHNINLARIDLAAAYRMAERQGFNEGICNHFTMMVPGSDDRFLLIPYGLHWSEVTASNLIEVDFDGNVLDDGGYSKAFDDELRVDTSALCIHAPVHQARSDARCVFHTHMPYATALTMLDDFRFPMASQNELGFYGRVAYDDTYNGVAHDHDEGRRLAAVLGNNDILMMANHGVLITGETIGQAYYDMFYLEQACRTLVLALRTGQDIRRVPQDVAAMTAKQRSRAAKTDNIRRHFNALKRLLDRDDPGYKD